MFGVLVTCGLFKCFHANVAGYPYSRHFHFRRRGCSIYGKVSDEIQIMSEITELGEAITHSNRKPTDSRCFFVSFCKSSTPHSLLLIDTFLKY